ncbi:hypothetical protein ACFQ0M_05965 [Kitasatospora aburaviensis]
MTAAHDWHGVGLSAVAGWHRRWRHEWWGPAAAALPVYAVVPDWWARDRALSGLETLLQQVVRPAVDGARGAVTALTLARLTSAFQEVRLEGRAQAAALGWALDAHGLPRPRGPATRPTSPGGPSSGTAWTSTPPRRRPAAPPTGCGPPRAPTRTGPATRAPRRPPHHGPPPTTTRAPTTTRPTAARTTAAPERRP